MMKNVVVGLPPTAPPQVEDAGGGWDWRGTASDARRRVLGGQKGVAEVEKKTPRQDIEKSRGGAEVSF